MNAACDPILDVRLSQQQLKELYERNPALAKRNSGSAVGYIGSPNGVACSAFPEPAKPNKYRNIKVEYDGMKFDSKHELACWKNLKLREKAGEIKELNRQVPFDLKVNGQKVGKITVDFTWEESVPHSKYWKTVIADAKSPATRKETAYRLRKKIFEAQYAPLVIQEL